jgi:hypothetical protein
MMFCGAGESRFEAVSFREPLAVEFWWASSLAGQFELKSLDDSTRVAEHKRL